MKGMVGFRNVLVHEYQQMDLSIMVDVIERHLNDPLNFADMALKALITLDESGTPHAPHRTT